MILANRNSARLASVATATPAHRVDQSEAIRALTGLFPDERADFIESVVRGSGVETRYSVASIDELLAGTPDFTARNLAYHAAATALAEAAARKALARAALSADQIDVIVDVSCTGIAIPALDVTLSPRLGLRPDVRRIPITEAGCAAGALALGVAANFAEAGLRVLVVAVELCTLSLCKEDASRTNLIAGVLFGDGAAAAIVAPDAEGPEIRAVSSHLIPDTHRTMGFDVGGHGLQIRLERELPIVLRKELPDAVASFLTAHGREAEGIGLHLVHPGGRKILEAYEERFGLGPGGLVHSREALRTHGNLSSASILVVLEDALLRSEPLTEDLEALLVAVGPGLSLEFLLLGWDSLPAWTRAGDAEVPATTEA